MKQKKFKTQQKANNFAPNGWIAKKGKACKLKDGSKANWYTFVKKGSKKRKR